MGTVNAGVASLSISSLSVGTHTITASYVGSGSTYAGSTSTALPITVTTIATTTSLAVSAASAPVGTAVNLTATVSPAAAAGTVTFYDGSTALGTGTLASGVATFSSSSLALGAHSITAVYGGGTPYAGSSSAATAVTMTKIATGTVLSASATTTTPTSSVTLTATVSPTAAAGTVTFYDGTTTLGVGTLSSGAATLAVSNLAVGDHAITAVYAGAGNYAGSTSNAVTITGHAVATTTTLTSSATTAGAGSSVTFTATVSSTAATGTVTFYDGTASIGTGTLSAGVATLSTTTLAVGSHSVTASYGGDGTYAISTSAAVVVTINVAPTTLALVSSTASATAGTNVTFTATVNPTAATGTVTFYDGTASVGTGTLSSGVATLSTTTLAAGSHSITASYGGDGTHGSSTSAAVAVTINVVPTTLALVSSTASATAGTNVTFTGTVNPTAATGTIAFYDGSILLGSNPLSSGVAILTLSNLSAGVHFVTASYPGATGYLSSTSNGVAITINKASTAPISGTYSGPSLTGKVMAGALPVTGASVQFYAAGATGYGVTAGNLIASPITTDSSGSFTIPSGYSCPVATTQVYLVATGGTTSSGVYAPLEFLSALGSCNALPRTVVVNEVTTVSAAWPLAQFLGVGGSIGTSATNNTGLVNAFGIAGSLASTTTGTSPGASFPANATSPVAKINALANLLNTCAGSNAACLQFFLAAGSGATNTLDAARAVVLNPAANPTALYMLSKNSSAYTPTLSAAPPDWTLFTVISGNGLSGTSGVGVLSTGNVWVGNYYGTASQFTPLAAPAFAPVSGYGIAASYWLAVDQSDNAWIPNDVFNGSVTKLSPDGTTGANFGGSGMEFPVFTAIDPDATVWVADNGNSTITHLSSAGAGLAAYSIPEINFPTALAVDANHNVWSNYQTDYTVTRINPDGTHPLVVKCCNGPTFIAIDQRGFVWVANHYGSTLSELSSAGAVVATGLKGGGMMSPQALAIDGVGNVWVANFGSSGISEFSGSQSSSPGTALSPATGFGSDGPIPGGYSIAVDASGNVWMANFQSSNVIRYLGLAAPTKSPSIGPAQAP
jgi:streptogramin lyase